MGNQRTQVLALVADAVMSRGISGRMRVAVDGVDGAGKTWFADEVAEVLRVRGRTAVRISVDGFHHPARVRHARGRDSPEGYYLDSYDYDRLFACVLDPFGPGGSGHYVPAVYDVHSEVPVHVPPQQAEAGAVLVLDGIFVNRDELVRVWDYSVFLDVPFDVSIPRFATRDRGDVDPAAPANRRYIEGQRRYFERCHPRERADMVIDNTDLARPRVLRMRT